MSYFSSTDFDGNILPCTSSLDACKVVFFSFLFFFQAYVFMDAITPSLVQTLIETLCNFVLDRADNGTFCCVSLSWLISNFCLNISLVSFTFIDSHNHKTSALWKKGNSTNTVSTNLSESLQSLTFLAKGSVQRSTEHKQMLAQNANTFGKIQHSSLFGTAQDPLRMREKEVDFWARLSW